MQTYISQQAIKLKIKPEHLEICKSVQNGWSVTVKYSYGRQEKLNRLIKEEQIRRQLKGFTTKEKNIVIKQMLNIEKIISKNNLKIKLI